MFYHFVSLMTNRTGNLPLYSDLLSPHPFVIRCVYDIV